MHKKIMIQGTGSSVGKSVIVTGLCRIFVQDGYRVSPFKSQNMALNSFVDIDGLEMGRAQVVQAEACKEIPRAFMNPILLKPNSDNNSQIVVEGKVLSNMRAKDYFANSNYWKEIALRNYNKIERNFDIGVLEGGGSPAEINLREYDYVNMGMAELVDAPVILIGNIEMGGVFASLYGTIALLDESDRKRIKGLIINKFRGDSQVLKPGIDMFMNKLKIQGLDIKFLGVIPYEKLEIEEEDSLVENINKYKKEDGNIKISVIRLDKMSNFTDFYSLNRYPDVSLKYVYSYEELGEEDIIILPGTKNTISDLEKLKINKIYDKIKKMYEDGVILVGICGGFQMLGREIEDLYGIEGKKKCIKGFNILNIKTTLEKVKITEQTEKILINDLEESIIRGCENLKIRGYEIHQGISKGEEKNLILGGGLTMVARENILGTYIHGIFDNEKFTRKFLNNVRLKKGLKPLKGNFTFSKLKEREYDKLAKLLREHLDIGEIYKIMK
ncbi:Cobyric acid synthase [Fusobacterium necrogenes]|uniref:Cobyric acid synthase n=1 Tax=Fusobacterium necrogenes TaxID=858 RepID=A0A377GYV8_9FUSO|nr:cobyric acid synthase [Fusobacterium necrogenes]STO31774.1 Cobyric acid synthase [Fusobacterium necrogenes]